MREDGLMIRDSDFCSVVSSERHDGYLLRKKHSIGPCRRLMFHRVVVVRTLIVLVSRLKHELALLASLEHLICHAVHVKLIPTHQLSEVFLRNSLLDFILRHINTEIKTAKEDFHVVVVHFIVLELSATLSFVSLTIQVVKLLETLLSIAREWTSR